MGYKNPILEDIDLFIDSKKNTSHVYIGDCVYCGAKDVPLTSTSETDVICIDCMRLTRDNCNTAIKELSQFSKNNHIKNQCKKESLDDLKAKAEDALFKMTGQHIELD